VILAHRSVRDPRHARPEMTALWLLIGLLAGAAAVAAALRPRLRLLALETARCSKPAPSSSTSARGGRSVSPRSATLRSACLRRSRR
jgi:hypothetical protein